MDKIGENSSSSSSSKNQMELSLTPSNEGKSYMGYAGVILGVIGIFSSAIFTVIGLVCAVIALFMGQFSLGVIGLLLALAGIVTSPIIMGMIGLSTILAWFT
ncbi:MAG: hypothetical protein OQJ97_09970 [Rhodospirillales bacterium]|nr:hypothetical protein [Rhodospirillales bacterium]